MTNLLQTCRKRRRTDSDASLPTPPTFETAGSHEDATEADGLCASDALLDSAADILWTEAAALAHITKLYTTSNTARTDLKRAVNAILEAQRRRSKLVVCGVGKSAFIAQKFVATCKSLSISASFLHACEAVHGDLGDVREDDVVMFVSYSGRTPELLNLLHHLPEGVQIVALTGQTREADCRLLDGRDDGRGILLPAPVHEKEEASFGVAAPTTSTTAALAVTDMLALTIAREMHGERTREVFQRNHPGGAIGMVAGKEVKKVRREKEVEVAILELPSPSISGEDDQ